MKAKCLVTGCKRKTGYAFPSNKQLQQKWIRGLGLSNYSIQTPSIVCLKHFSRARINRIAKTGLPSEPYRLGHARNAEPSLLSEHKDDNSDENEKENIIVINWDDGSSRTSPEPDPDINFVKCGDWLIAEVPADYKSFYSPPQSPTRNGTNLTKEEKIGHFKPQIKSTELELAEEQLPNDENAIVIYWDGGIPPTSSERDSDLHFVKFGEWLIAECPADDKIHSVRHNESSYLTTSHGVDGVLPSTENEVNNKPYFKSTVLSLNEDQADETDNTILTQYGDTSLENDFDTSPKSIDSIEIGVASKDHSTNTWISGLERSAAIAEKWRSYVDLIEDDSADISLKVTTNLEDKDDRCNISYSLIPKPNNTHAADECVSISESVLAEDDDSSISSSPLTVPQSPQHNVISLLDDSSSSDDSHMSTHVKPISIKSLGKVENRKTLDSADFRRNLFRVKKRNVIVQRRPDPSKPLNGSSAPVGWSDNLDNNKLIHISQKNNVRLTNAIKTVDAELNGKKLSFQRLPNIIRGRSLNRHFINTWTNNEDNSRKCTDNYSRVIQTFKPIKLKTSATATAPKCKTSPGHSMITNQNPSKISIDNNLINSRLRFSKLLRDNYNRSIRSTLNPSKNVQLKFIPSKRRVDDTALTTLICGARLNSEEPITPLDVPQTVFSNSDNPIEISDEESIISDDGSELHLSDLDNCNDDYVFNSECELVKSCNTDVEESLLVEPTTTTVRSQSPILIFNEEAPHLIDNPHLVESTMHTPSNSSPSAQHTNHIEEIRKSCQAEIPGIESVQIVLNPTPSDAYNIQPVQQDKHLNCTDIPTEYSLLPDHDYHLVSDKDIIMSAAEIGLMNKNNSAMHEKEVNHVGLNAVENVNKEELQSITNNKTDQTKKSNYSMVVVISDSAVQSKTINKNSENDISVGNPECNDLDSFASIDVEQQNYLDSIGPPRTLYDPFCCKECDEPFPSKEALFYHKRKCHVKKHRLMPKRTNFARPESEEKGREKRKVSFSKTEEIIYTKSNDNPENITETFNDSSIESIVTYLCPQCNFGANSDSILRTHIDVHHKVSKSMTPKIHPRNFQPALINYEPGNAEIDDIEEPIILPDNDLIYNEFFCDSCNFSSSEMVLSLHALLIHEQEDSIKLPTKCVLCSDPYGLTFCDFYNLRVHLKYTHMAILSSRSDIPLKLKLGSKRSTSTIPTRPLKNKSCGNSPKRRSMSSVFHPCHLAISKIQSNPTTRTEIVSECSRSPIALTPSPEPDDNTTLIPYINLDQYPET